MNIFSRQKAGATGEGVIMMYRIVLVILIAITIFGVSAIFYNYSIDVRHSEAEILTKQVETCLSPSGTLNLDNIQKDSEKKILDYCEVKNIERFYVNVSVLVSGKVIKNLEAGDSGQTWVKAIFDNNQAGPSLVQYEPGYYKAQYNSVVSFNGQKMDGVILIESYVNAEVNS